jgi:hypothetical protein
MTDHSSIELTVDLELSDLLRANYWHFFQRTRLKWALPLVLGVTVLSMWRWAAHPDEVGALAFLVGLILPLSLLTGLLAGVAAVYIGARKSLATNKSLREDIHYRFSTTGITATAPSSSGSTTWENVYSAFETRNAFLIFISHNIMYVIPKRCFRDNEQAQAFRELLQEQLGERVRLTRME